MGSIHLLPKSSIRFRIERTEKIVLKAIKIVIATLQDSLVQIESLRFHDDWFVHAKDDKPTETRILHNINYQVIAFVPLSINHDLFFLNKKRLACRYRFVSLSTTSTTISTTICCK
jgi:hypothetical protein